MVSIRVRAELKKELEAHAREQGKTLSAFINDALEALARILASQRKGKDK